VVKRRNAISEYYNKHRCDLNVISCRPHAERSAMAYDTDLTFEIDGLCNIKHISFSKTQFNSILSVQIWQENVMENSRERETEKILTLVNNTSRVWLSSYIRVICALSFFRLINSRRFYVLGNVSDRLSRSVWTFCPRWTAKK